MKGTVILVLEFILLTVFGCIFLNNVSYSKTERACFKAYRYTKGIIYIGNDKCLNTIEKEENDVMVLDAREKKNSDMKIYNSYLIKDEKIQKEVISYLLKYEGLRPSSWKRTDNSMLNEWVAHNLLYSVGIQKDRTKDVDFDNNDEDLYKERLGLNTLIKYYSR